MRTAKLLLISALLMLGTAAFLLATVTPPSTYQVAGKHELPTPTPTVTLGDGGVGCMAGGCPQ